MIGNKKVSTDALLISDYYDILYTTGFATANPLEREAYVLCTQKQTYIITDQRYHVNTGKKNIQVRYLKQNKTVIDILKDIICEEQIQILSFESHHITVEEIRSLAKLGVMLKPVVRPLQESRSIKTKKEQTLIRKACQILTVALDNLIHTIKIGMTEKEIAWEFEVLVRKIYGADLAFETIVAVDKNSAIPHYQTGDRGETKLKKGSVVLIDAGVRWKRYCSDITRMVVFGEPPPSFIKAYTILRQVQEHTIKQLYTCFSLRYIDAYCRSQLQKNGYGLYPHSTGHGIGLEVHESPRIRSKSIETKKSGQIFTIEPGIYMHNQWGIRIEDTILIRSDGSPEVLTVFSKDLVRIPA